MRLCAPLSREGSAADLDYSAMIGVMIRNVGRGYLRLENVFWVLDNFRLY